jgi:hypothetical protein
MKRKRRSRGLKSAFGVLVLAGVIASSAYAFTASITVPATQAGEGTAAVSSPTTASAVNYVIDATDASKISQVNLTFNTGWSANSAVGTPTTSMKIQFNGSGQPESNACTPVVASETGASPNIIATQWQCTWAANPTINPLATVVVSAVTTYN